MLHTATDAGARLKVVAELRAIDGRGAPAWLCHATRLTLARAGDPREPQPGRVWRLQWGRGGDECDDARTSGFIGHD